MTNDAALFKVSPDPGLLPLYEAKLFHQYNHRWATYAGDDVRQVDLAELMDPTYSVVPHYWVESQRVRESLEGRWDRDWLLCLRGIARATDERTLISSVIPLAGVGNSAPIAISNKRQWPLAIANFCSLALDWVTRQKVGGPNLNFFILEQLPVLPPAAYQRPIPWAPDPLFAWLRPYIGELTYTSWDLAEYARDLGWHGPPFRWSLERRFLLRAELDAAFFHLYGFQRGDVLHVMESFSAIKERDLAIHATYRTEDMILATYDAMADATPERPFVSSLVPSPGDPTVAHPPRSGEAVGRWVPWADVERRVARGPATPLVNHPITRVRPDRASRHPPSHSLPIQMNNRSPTQRVHRQFVALLRARHRRP